MLGYWVTGLLGTRYWVLGTGYIIAGQQGSKGAGQPGNGSRQRQQAASMIIYDTLIHASFQAPEYYSLLTNIILTVLFCSP